MRNWKILRNTSSLDREALHIKSLTQLRDLSRVIRVIIADNQNTLKSGERSPSLLEDFHFREKITHFHHERIPERIVHARGSGAHGYFEVTNPIPHVTRSSFLAEKGKKTEVFARLSTVAGGAGASDIPSDVRGLRSNSITTRAISTSLATTFLCSSSKDAIKFPDLIHSVKMEESDA